MAALKGVKLDPDMQARLEALARTKDRSAHWIMCAAIRSYIEREEQYEREKREDMARWERYQLTGEAVTHEAAITWLGRLAEGGAVSCPK